MIQKVKCTCGLWRQIDGTVAAYSHKYRRKCEPITEADRAAINAYQRQAKKANRIRQNTSASTTSKPSISKPEEEPSSDPLDGLDWSLIDPQNYFDYLAGKRSHILPKSLQGVG